MASSATPSASNSASTSSSPSASSFRLDCSRLLHAVADQEAIYRVLEQEEEEQDETTTFGHPDDHSPIHSVRVHCLSKDATLVFAHTAHFLYCQPAKRTATTTTTTTKDDETDEFEPFEVCRFTDGDDDCKNEITCMTTVRLDEDVEAWLLDDDENDDENEDGDGGTAAVDDNDSMGVAEESKANSSFRVTLDEDADDEQGIDAIMNTTATTTTATTTAATEVDKDHLFKHKKQQQQQRTSLLKGVLSSCGTAESERVIRLSVVVGTTQSRVYAVELQFRPNGTLLNSSSSNSSNSSLNLYEVLPHDDNDDDATAHQHATTLENTSGHSNNNNIHHHHQCVFRPSGGVASIQPFRSKDNNDEGEALYVWITYKDGTLLRVHAAGLFPSVWSKGGVLGKSIDELLADNNNNGRRGGFGTRRKQPSALLRCQVYLDSNNNSNSNRTIVPLPHSFPSPLAALPFEPWKVPMSRNLNEDDEEEESEEDDDDTPRKECISAQEEDEGRQYEHANNNIIVEALVFGSDKKSNNSNPTLAFYTSELQFFDGCGSGTNNTNALLFARTLSTTTASFDGSGGGGSGDIPVLGAVVGGTKALVGGVFGALKWGIGGIIGGGGGGGGGGAAADGDIDKKKDEEVDKKDVMIVDTTTKADAFAPFPTLWNAPIALFPGQELHDAPRQIESCCIDPDGHLAALSDTLGRVLLLDLETKQVVRLWKGYRDATCSWIHGSPDDSASMSPFRKKPPLHLAIYSRQRRVVDVWRVRHHGPPVSSSAVVDRGAQLVGPVGLSPSSNLVSSFVLSSAIPGAPLNQLEQILIESNSVTSTTSSQVASSHASPLQQSSSSKTVASSRDAALKLQRLRQLLSTTSVSFTGKDVFQALCEIKSLVDLATALDLLSRANVLEDKLGVAGSTFHKQVVAYCKEVLNAAIQGSSSGSSKDNTAVAVNPNVVLLTVKIEYHSQLIRAFDVLYKFEMSASDEDMRQNVKNPSHWVLESVGWASLYEEVMNVDLDQDIPVMGDKKATFSQFCASCCPPKNEKETAARRQQRIHFSDSSRTRRDIIIHVFKPLLADIFSFKVVYSIFDSLAIQDDVSYLLKCFGEWIMTLSVKELYQKGLLAAQSPLQRFLHDMATRELDKGNLAEGEIVLGVLHSFCTQATDLVRAFMLAVMCRETAEAASSRKEKITYGRILSSRVISDWDNLLRKLRVCLLVSIRLKHVRLAAPISVHNVNEEDLFSVYEWLAHDELRMSQKNDEILSMEIACKISNFAFDPSTSDGDGPSRFKQMKNSCLTLAMDEDEHAEYLVEFDEKDRFGSLLLFFPSYNEHLLLVAHRARILSSMWSKEPANLEILQDALDALSSLHKCTDMSPIAVALCLDVWHTSICPIYRAQLFGFDYVQELSEEIVEPLLRNDDWLASFGKTALEILGMLQTPMSENGAMILEAFRQSEESKAVWPPVRTDHILKRLIYKARKVDGSALETHIAVASSLLVSKDVDSLVKCVPAIYECFTPQALFDPVAQPAHITPLRFAFLKETILGRARSYDGLVMDRFVLGEIETLCTIWAFDLNEARTLFLLAMYEVGKDRIVDDLLTKCTSQIYVQSFVEGGVDIACRRLHAFLNGREMTSPAMRETMGLLDADLCEWIRNRARQSLPSTPVVQNYVSIGMTHLFALRLLSLCASSSVDTELRIKIHSMVVLSGTLVKVLEISGVRRS